MRMRRLSRAGAFGPAALVLGMVALLVTPAGAQTPAAPPPSTGPPPGAALPNPPNQPERGMVYNGLERASEGRCRGQFRVKNTDLCTHGPDEAAPGGDVHQSVAPLPTTAASTAAVCDGDGVSGKRTQVIYARSSDRADRYGAYLTSFRQWAAEADTIYNDSAAETGGSRRVRFVHDPSCVVSVANAVMPAYGDDDFGTTTTVLQSQGFNRTDRKYLVFVDANVYCGIGNILGDDQPGAANTNNGGPSFGRTDAGCWGGQVAAHEHMHNLGGVQLSAPHASGGWHCVDDYDRMCYSDAPNYPTMQIRCPATAHERLFDCNHDDYFHTNPPAGSYLATKWNTANSAFLIGAPGSPVGSLDAVSQNGTGVRFRGWARDPDTSTPIAVHAYVTPETGVATTANLARPDVGGYAYDVTRGGIVAGTYNVCAYGINAPGTPGGNTTLGCRAFTVTQSAMGNLEVVSQNGTGVRFRGWALDPDTSAPIQVHAYVTPETGVATVADINRPDVGAEFTASGSTHGFDVTRGGIVAGTYNVCAYGINAPGTPGGNTLLGCRTVTVS